MSGFGLGQQGCPRHRRRGVVRRASVTINQEPRATLEAALESHDVHAATAALRALTQTGELPDRMARLTIAEARKLAEVLGDEALGELLGELDPGDAAAILSLLAAVDAADVLESMDPDEAADVVGEISPDRVDEILFEMEPIEAEELRGLLLYSPDTAGGRMTPAFVSIAPDLTARQAISALQRLSEQAETISYVYVTAAEDHLLGVLSLRLLDR